MDFIEVDLAKKILTENIIEQSIIEQSLLDAQFMYAAADIYAPIDVPSFDNSAMDGYCFLFEDFKNQETLKISYTIQAGDINLPILKKGEVARIYTGAPIPLGADTVVMQEKTNVDKGNLEILDRDINKGQNIRKRATQTRKGEIILHQNSQINAGIIGFLATFGIQKISSYSKPKIGILVTGNELKSNDETIHLGQIFESNSSSLIALLKEIPIETSVLKIVHDELEIIFNSIKELLDQVDIVIITGGISVGDYDFVKEALEKNQVEKLFYKVKQKPGKPIYFGKKATKRIFALPGNPASTFICFHQYVKPFIELCLGAKNVFEKTQTGVLNHDYIKKGTLTNFVKAHVTSSIINILEGQESYKMKAFQQANCLVELAADKSIFNKGDQLTYRMI